MLCKRTHTAPAFLVPCKQTEAVTFLFLSSDKCVSLFLNSCVLVKHEHSQQIVEHEAIQLSMSSQNKVSGPVCLSILKAFILLHKSLDWSQKDCKITGISWRSCSRAGPLRVNANSLKTSKMFFHTPSSHLRHQHILERSVPLFSIEIHESGSCSTLMGIRKGHSCFNTSDSGCCQGPNATHSEKECLFCPEKGQRLCQPFLCLWRKQQRALGSAFHSADLEGRECSSTDVCTSDWGTFIGHRLPNKRWSDLWLSTSLNNN